MNKKIDILLARYFSGEVTAEEIRHVDQWIAESKENENYFTGLSSLYQNLLTSSVQMPTPDLDKAFDRFSDHIHQDNAKREKISRIRLSKFYKAAMVSVFIATGILTVLLSRSPKPSVRITATEQTETYSIDRGTDVRLGTGSQIEYKKGKRNEVHLKGTAMFDVKSNKEKELLVVAGETFIKDIGTIFTVAANDPQKSVTVDVTEGEVLFYTLKDKGLVIKKGERGVYDSKTKMFTSLVMEEKRKTENKPIMPKDEQSRIPETEEQNMSDKQSQTREQILPKNVQEILFDAESLANIVAQLESLYDVKIEIAPELSQRPISISFEKEEDIEYVLVIISETLSGRLYKNGDIYVLSRE